MNAYLIVFFGAALSSLFLTRIVRDLAIRRGWVDEPDDVRKFHAQPVPSTGGMAIAVSTFAAIAVAMAIPSVAVRFQADLRQFLTLFGLAFAMMFVGLWDDLADLSARRKFALQVVVGCVAWGVGIRIEGWDAAGLHFGYLSLPITLLWMIGITNAFNLIDGVDGLAAGAALFATLSLLVVSISTAQPAVAILLAALAGSTAGFLRYNFNPASIFLGDSGSLFLGFLLSILAIESSQKSAAVFTIAVPIVSLGLPVLDTVVVTIRRMVRRQPLFQGDRRHLHHVLLDRGLTARQVVIWLYAACGMLGMLSLLVAVPSRATAGPVLVMLGIAVGIAVQQLQIPELRALNAHVVRGIYRQRRLLAISAVMHSLLDELAAAHDFSEILNALSKSLDEAGFVAARIRLPTVFFLRGGRAMQWAHTMDGGEGGLHTFEWRSLSKPTEASEITLSSPLVRIGPSSQITLVTDGDDGHHDGLITWLTQDVSLVVEAHLLRLRDNLPDRP